MDGGAAIGRRRIGAGQHIDALAPFMRAVRPDAFGDHHAPLHAVEEPGVQHQVAAPVADLDAAAILDAERFGIFAVDEQLRPAFLGLRYRRLGKAGIEEVA